MKKIITLLIGLLPIGIYAQTPTWAEDVAPILYAHCTSCHHNGGIGGFPLMTYQEAIVPYIDIQNAVNTGEMPPWKADPSYRHFKDENILTATEIATINDWISGGKPEGNPNNAPTPPTYTAGSQLSQVDLNLTIPQYTIGSNQDDYRSFVLTNPNNFDTYLNQIEYLPGNSAVVHHIVFYFDPSTQSRTWDQLAPGPGFPSYGVGPLSNAAEWIGAWAPGQGPTILPPNMGIKIPASADLVIEVHYAPGFSGQQDQSQINMSFTPAAGVRQVFTEPLLDYQNDITNGPLEIPANTVKTFHQQDNTPSMPISLIDVFPHMHRIGTSYKIYSIKNNDTLPIIYIPKWDFHWQGYYTLQRLTKIEGNSMVHGIASYDNTTNNPDNPSNPPENVTAGENTKDEMMIAFFTYTYYQSGDENIIMDSTLLNTSLPPNLQAQLRLYPNPVIDQVKIELGTADFGGVVKAILRDVQGKFISETPILPSVSEKIIDLRGVAQGQYFLEIHTEKGAATYKIWKH